MDENVLMICDGEKSVGIAGIMGGENSMITDDVKTMLFEAACLTVPISAFPPSGWDCAQTPPEKFEKGLDPKTHRRLSTGPASWWKSWAQAK